jgi:hypothetical protein
VQEFVVLFELDEGEQLGLDQFEEVGYGGVVYGWKKGVQRSFKSLLLYSHVEISNLMRFKVACKRRKMTKPEPKAFKIHPLLWSSSPSV